MLETVDMQVVTKISAFGMWTNIVAYMRVKENPNHKIDILPHPESSRLFDAK